MFAEQIFMQWSLPINFTLHPEKPSGETLTQDKKTLMSSGQEQLSLLKQCCEADIVLQDFLCENKTIDVPKNVLTS